MSAETEAAAELERVARLIAYHSQQWRYHTEDAPEISDADYDALVKRNNELEAAFPDLVRGHLPRNRLGRHRRPTCPRSRIPSRC